MAESQIVPRDTTEVAHTATPDRLLAIAVEKGASMDQLEKLMELQERWEANEARKAYTAAMAAFRAEAPTIRKNAEVDFRSKEGKRTHYRHASLDHICEVINPVLARHGLTYAWVTEQQEGKVTVHCEVTHVMGHKERVTLTGPYDQSGNKNSIQAVGSAVSYLQRYTLLPALGLATGGMDDDGQSAGVKVETISEDDALELNDMLEATGVTRQKLLDLASRSCGWQITSLRDIPAEKLEAIKTWLGKQGND